MSSDPLSIRLRIESDMRNFPGHYVSMGTRMREVREAMEWSRETCSQVLGVHQQTVYNWENNVRSPGWYYVVLLARSAEVPLDLFFSGVGPLRHEVQDVSIAVGEKRDAVTDPHRPRHLSCPGSGEACPSDFCFVCDGKVGRRRGGLLRRHPVGLQVEKVVPPETPFRTEFGRECVEAVQETL